MAEVENTKKDGLTLKEKILYGAGGLVVLGGGFVLIRKWILNAISNREEKKTLDEGSPATFAKQIKMAFDNDGWPGTDTPALRNTMREIPDRDTFDKVVKSYQKLYNSNLMYDLSDELQTTEYNEMLQIIDAKPTKKGQSVNPDEQYSAWAKRLQAAFDKTYGPFPGTDEKAIVAVFNEMPTQNAFIKTGVAYMKIYGKNLITELKSELENGEYAAYMTIILQKPKS